MVLSVTSAGSSVQSGVQCSLPSEAMTHKCILACAGDVTSEVCFMAGKHGLWCYQ